VARQAYIDPDKSAISREEGNRLFKEGSFAEAVKSYTEAIRRDPSDARGYNNRAAAYQKLVALPEALKDAEEAIKIDPTFGVWFLPHVLQKKLTYLACMCAVKAYIRKSNILVGMRDYTKALEAVQEAEDHDTDGKHKAEIQQQALKCQQALFTERAGESEEDTLNRAMRDPEIAVSDMNFLYRPD
jgi:stress-induced-phosphoprotein 1